MKTLWVAVLISAGAAISEAQTFTGPEIYGRVNAASITQASGLAVGLRNPPVLWTHNDETDARVFALSTNGTLLATYTLGVPVTDLEDIAVATLPDGRGPHLYVGDLGNNFGGRDTILILRAPEPVVEPAWGTAPRIFALSNVEVFALRYPDGVYNAEPLLIDPLTSRLYVLTKGSGYSRIYSADITTLQHGTTTVLRFEGETYFPWLTAGTVSADGATIALRSAGSAKLWRRLSGQAIPDLLRTPGTAIPVVGPPSEQNGEGITFVPSGYLTISEGAYQPLNHFRAEAPAERGSALWLGRDNTTRGNWIGKFGTEGHVIYADSSVVPSYATIAAEGAATWVWSDSTADARALVRRSGNGRIAACWYSPSQFSVMLTFRDNAEHDAGFYLLDWDRNQRSQRIDILDATTGALLDSRTVESFQDGSYVRYRLSGDVRVRFTRSGGFNAVLSAIFLDPVASDPAPQPEPEPPKPSGIATFLGADTTAQGSWRGRFGSQGVAIHGDQNSLQLAPAGAATHIWAYHTSQLAALQKSASASRIASCWYSAGVFTSDIPVAQGQIRKFSAYFLDWDRAGRAQRAEVIDPATGVLLDTRDLTAFENGVYLRWEVDRTVRLRITRTAGPNAVLSGVFLD